MKTKTKKPKGPRSAYIYFVKDYQRHLRKTQGPMSFGESSRLCAARWKRLPQKMKTKYKKMSERDAFRYKKELEGLSEKDLRMLRKKKRDPAAPLRPMSAYLWFCQSKWKQVAEQNPHMRYTQVMKHLAKLWTKCDQKTREKFERMAECDRKCYQMEKAKYRAQCNRKIKI